VLFVLLGHVLPRLVEALSGCAGLDQVCLGSVFAEEEDRGNVKAELLSGEKRQNFGFSPGICGGCSLGVNRENQCLEKLTLTIANLKGAGYVDCIAQASWALR
jgi:hypothetical protein